jgi:hypothetical protein
MAWSSQVRGLQRGGTVMGICDALCISRVGPHSIHVVCKTANVIGSQMRPTIVVAICPLMQHHQQHLLAFR